jgi:Animal haem peroxidase
VVVRAAATSASTAEPPTATEAAVESVAGISSAVEGAPETQAVAQPFSDPSAPPNPVTDVVSKVLASVGLNPFASDSPVAPVDSPAMWAMLAMARKQEDVAGPSSFGRMFGDLEPLNQQTNEQLRLEAQKMLEEAAIANPKGTTAGITFFGQFIDHDLTLDTLPQPDAPVNVNTLVNGRTFAFDLDSVYGGGPEKSPQVYDGDKFKIGVATDGVSPDLPRVDGSAILIEPRNDENLIIGQIHLSFLRLHNTLVDQGMSFDEAHDTVVNAYRYVVLHDYLPQIVGQDAVDAALKQPVNTGFYQPGTGTPFTPVEFSVAAFRFGHSQVRNAYNINDTSGGVPVFSLDPTVLDLHGGRQLPAIEDPANGLKSLVIDFDNFFSELPREVDDDPALIGRAIDTKISLSLFQLPIPGAEGGGDNVLAFRNLLRAKFYDMPSGEAVAEAMGIPEEQIIRDPLFPEGTPLWFYILREAEILNQGAELGPVGGGIVAEVFVDLLRQDSGYKTVEKPNLPDVSGGDFRIGDLLVAADQPVEEEPLNHRLRNRAATEKVARHRAALMTDPVGTASTNNFTGQMTLCSSHPGAASPPPATSRST